MDPAPPPLEPPAPDDDPSRDGGSPGGSASGGGGRGGVGPGGRVPPHSLEAEVSVLGAAMLSRSAASEVTELLIPDDFYRSAHATVFAAIQDLVARGDAVDTVTVLDWVMARGRLDEIGGPAAVSELTAAVPTAANAAHYARIVHDKALLRRLIEAGTSVTRMGFEATEDARAAVDRAEAEIFKVAEHGTKTDYSVLKDLLNESFERIEKLASDNSEVTGLATGFNDLDRLTAGLQPENLIILAARPAMGKSSLALNLAQYVTVSLKRPAILFSLEMSKIEIVNRMLSAEAGIDSNKIKTGRLEDSDWRRLGDALGRLADAPFYIDDTASVSMLEISAKCRRLKQREGLDLVIVDYLQLMQSHRQIDSRQQEVSEISRGLKMLAKDLKVPVIALSQLSRQPESRVDKRPQLSDLRESGSIEQDADIVGFIYRDEVYDDDTPDKGIAELIVAKHRNGATRTVRLAFLNHLTKFANLAPVSQRGGPPPPDFGGSGPL
jgi:replicative DNA helicase